MEEKTLEQSLPGKKTGYEGGVPQIDPAREKKLVRKLDLHIIPV
jgi:hypothetical protein